MNQQIVLVCSRLDLPGGIERATVNLANLFTQKGHVVTLLILDTTSESFYTIDKDVQVICRPYHLGITSTGNAFTRKWAFVRQIRELKVLFKQLGADFIIGTEYPLSIAAYLAGRKSGATIYAWEHNHINWIQKNWFWDTLFRQVYPRLQGVVCNNATEQHLYEKIRCHAITIPNSIIPVPSSERAPLTTKQLLTVGWLIPRKGVDFIPAIAEKIFSIYPDWTWKIIGKGPEYDNLQGQIQRKGLPIEVLEPTSPDLTTIYQDTSLYVMTSRFECFPMVLLEALSFGIPCMAFDCPTGPADIIIPDKNGYLAPLGDVNTLAEQLIYCMGNDTIRQHLGNGAFDSSHHYWPDQVYLLWQQLFEERS